MIFSLYFYTVQSHLTVNSSQRLKITLKYFFSSICYLCVFIEEQTDSIMS